MKRTRGLWVSIIFVLILVVASLVGFATGSLKPTLGLDLEGGLSVILTAPPGTGSDVMEQALENIRHRVDAFGVGEPEILVSGTNIEVQLPGLATGTIRPQAKEQTCLTGPDGANYGCSTDSETVQQALGEIEVTPQPSKVCAVDGDGAQLKCFDDQQLADAFVSQLSVQPKASATPTPSGSTAPSTAPQGPSGGGQQCLTDTSGATYGCFKTTEEAQKAQKAVTTDVTENTYCLTAPSTSEPAAAPSASPTATPSKGKAKAKPSPSDKPSPGDSASPGASASPSPTPTPSAFSKLTRADGAVDLPCAFETKADAADAKDAVAVTDETQVFCVISSADKNLGCSLTRADAERRQKETGQEHLLEVIGQTARLEERPVLEMIPPGTDSPPLTCQTEEEKATKACSFEVLDTQDVYFPGPGGQTFHLAPAVIAGGDVKSAKATFQGATQQNISSGWMVDFTLTGSATKAFADATTAALGQPPPLDQIAIVVDRKVISNPQVQGAITTGTGQISGGFTEQRAKDLAAQLNAGALPIELTRQSVQTVSPTLGTESLRQGIIAGVVGLIALFLYLLFYYRLLGVVAWVGMSIWAILALALVSLAGTAFGYALTLAGVAGLVISLGVTADSYIVFFERLKDEVRSGRTPRSAVQPAFKRAYRTIVAADFVTAIAAVVLYVTAVSSVRGFALTLGVATALDLFVVWFFKRPTVFLIARNDRLVNLRGFGLSSGVAAEDPDAQAGAPAPTGGTAP